MGKKLLVLFGKAGSGKDTICKGLCSKFNINKLVRATTRPKREHEQDGIDYFFQDQFTLSNEILNNAEGFLEVGIFNDWIYATP
jgi:guanylate kinase